MPAASDVQETLPMDVTMAATPIAPDPALSPNHDADAKREGYQKQRRKETETKDATHENKHSESSTKAESKTVTKEDDGSKGDQKKERFTDSEGEAG